MVDVDVLDERLQLRALLDLFLAHRFGHLCSCDTAGVRRARAERRKVTGE